MKKKIYGGLLSDRIICLLVDTLRIVVGCSEAMGGTIRTVVMLLCESFEINLIIQ